MVRQRTINPDNFRRGFTLIELLVVISIISFISSVILASVNQARVRARDAQRISDMNQIRVALELYFDDLRSYPPRNSDTCTLSAAAYGLEAIVPTYMPVLPRDPASTAAAPLCYQYATPTNSGTQTTYHLGVSLNDTGHSALRGDKDCNSSIASSNNCPTAAVYQGGFNGGTADAESPGACELVSDTTRRCYDITP